MKRRSMTHRPTGIRIEVAKNLDGDPRVFIDMYGNSITSIGLTERSTKSLSNFLLEAAQMITDIRREKL